MNVKMLIFIVIQFVRDKLIINRIKVKKCDGHEQLYCSLNEQVRSGFGDDLGSSRRLKSREIHGLQNFISTFNISASMHSTVLYLC